MNRYRTVPGLGPQKATANTTCQKCLQKDKCFLWMIISWANFSLRHYSYECKATLQNRPYASRPSRSQQFNNPKLAPRLTNDKPNDLLESKGVADEVLAQAEAKREAEAAERRSRSPVAQPSSPKKTRARSVSSVDSVSTISTSRSRSKSRSPFRRRMSRGDSPARRPRRYSSRSMSKARGRKRRRPSESSQSRSRSRSKERHPGSHRKNRRYRTSTPEDRGRPNSLRRGSHRDSGSPSVNKSQVTRERRSMDDVDHTIDHPPKHAGGRSNAQAHRVTGDARQRQAPQRRERSLSPYSKRLALTQAMNDGR